MDEATTFATTAELEQVRKEQKRMAQRLEGIDAGLTDLTKEVAHLSERVADLSERTDRRFDELEARMVERHTELTRLIEDRHRALISAVMAPRSREGES